MNQRATCYLMLGGALVSLAAYSSGAACPWFRSRASRTVQAVQEVQVVQAAQPAQKSAKAEPDAAASKAVLANAKSYMDAFNRQDIKALLNLFAEDCDVTESDGTEVHGLKELEAELKDTFSTDPKARISVAVDSLRFVTPDVAIETGKTTYFPDGKTLVSETEYQVTHVKNGKRWLMSHVRAFNRKTLNPYDQLRDLEWLVGDWVDEGSDSLIETSYRWDANKAFLLQDFTIRIKGQKALTGTQRIGWDPLSSQIKAWVFDSEGGYGESLWSSVDDKYVIKMKGVRQDGKVFTATNELTQVAKDRLKFESVDRIVGEERMAGFTAFAVRRPPVPKK